MRTMLILLAAMAALTAGAYAQSPAPDAPAATPPASAPNADPSAHPAAKADAVAPAGSDASTQAEASGESTATQWTYKTKDGQMYEPPKQRPASPAMDLSIYGRT